MAGKSLIFKLALSGTPFALKYWLGSVYQLGKGEKKKRGKKKRGKRRKGEKKKKRKGEKKKKGKD